MKGFLLSPFDAEQYLLALPPMSERRVADAMRFRLSALYPGDAESAELDYVRNGGEKGAFILFVAGRERLSSFREASKGIPLVLPALMARVLAPRRGPWACLFSTQDWAALYLFEDGRMTAYRRVAAAAEQRECLEPLAAGIDGPSLGHATVLSSRPNAADTELLRRRCAELGIGAGSLSIVGLEEALSGMRPSRVAAFPLKPRSRNARRRVIAALACADALLAACLIAQYVGALDSESRRLEAKYLEAQKRNGASLRLMEEIQDKEKRYRELRSGETPDMYVIVSSIAMNIGAGSKITSLVVKEGAFQLEAEGRDALSALGSLQASGRFRDILLHQAVPGEDGLERYAISGRYANDGE